MDKNLLRTATVLAAGAATPVIVSTIERALSSIVGAIPGVISSGLAWWRDEKTFTAEYTRVADKDGAIRHLQTTGDDYIIICRFIEYVTTKDIKSTTVRGYYDGSVITVCACDDFMIEGLRVRFTFTPNTDGSLVTVKLVIWYRTVESLRELFTHINVDQEKRQKIPKFYQMERKGTRVGFTSVPCNGTKTFDNIFFPEKEKVLRLVSQYKEGTITKLAFFLHGIPGCGKTSFIKAIQEILGLHIVALDIAIIASDANLLRILRDPYLPIVEEEHASLSYAIVPLKKRLIIIEEADTIKSIQSRDLQHSNDTSSPTGLESPISTTLLGGNNMNQWATAIATAIKASNNDNNGDKASSQTMGGFNFYSQATGVTIGGLLVAFDGPVEFQGVLVMTTNKPELIDPALIRPGRMDMKIHMGLASEETGRNIIHKFWPDYRGPVPAGVLSPAEIDECCRLIEHVDELQPILERVAIEKKNVTPSPM